MEEAAEVRRVLEVPMVSGAEQHQILMDRNDTATPCPEVGGAEPVRA